MTATRPDRGSVTVEAAIAIGGLLAVVALCLAGFGAVVDQIRCVDAAREAARLVARGEGERALGAAADIAPEGAVVTVRTEGDTVSVSVRVGAGLLPVHLHGDAYAVVEPGGPP
ncbi:TadE family type IV pilus minor pilin [Actinokineospora auranticolor]|uniref:TadE-like protein n=1 Tax=Actinokineospora auranticolor TaxID=155976 RepID=A0A2S6GKW7_9PSEU|nr:TadE family type IV pilus minor pilin [Actinokineospora auranticolor]PPK65786.1 hypothetical protein CLV40_11246 [Actinokineospora auranticolor]